MNTAQRHTERIRAKRDALAVVGKLVEAATVAGWYGQKRLALDVQDGVVTLVRETDERTYHVGPRKKAA